MGTVSRCTGGPRPERKDSVLLSSKKSTPFRRLARVTVAGALIAAPLTLLAVNASAEAPAAAADVADTVVLEGTDVSQHPNDGPQYFQGPGPEGPRVEFRDGPNDGRRGPDDHRGPEGPQFYRILPQTGSAGSS